MSWKNYTLIALIGTASALVVGCGDEQDKRLSNADVACLKMLQAGATSCAPGGGVGGTTTVTATATVTVTNTVVK